MAEETNKPQVIPTIYERDEEFSSLYANNIQLEWSQLDLKMVFGVLDQSQQERLRVEQHTAINIPWVQAKLLVYYLEAQIGAFELQNGKIIIPRVLIPPEVPEPTEDQKKIPGTQELFNVIREVRNRFVKSL